MKDSKHHNMVSARGGQRIHNPTGPEREKQLPGVGGRESIMGRPMKGSGTDLSHSITGSSVKTR